MTLHKQHSWSPDTARDEAWTRRTRNRSRGRRSKSVTDDDLEELKACIELGFGFDSPESAGDIDPRLSHTLPALELYYAVQRSYNDGVAVKTRSSLSDGEIATASPLKSPNSIFQPSDKPEAVKKRLRHWATAVACTLQRSPPA